MDLRSAIGNVSGLGMPPPNDMRFLLVAYLRSSLISEGFIFFRLSENLNSIMSPSKYAQKVNKPIQCESLSEPTFYKVDRILC